MVVLVEGSITRANGAVQKGRWVFNPVTRAMDFEEQLPPSKLNALMVWSINQPVETLTSIYRLYDHEQVHKAAVSNVASAAKQVIHAQTKPQFETAVAAYAQQVRTASRALSLVTHPDKVKPLTPEVLLAFRQLSDLRDEVPSKARNWLLQWPSSSR